MKLFGFEVSVRKQQASPVVDNRGSWWPWVREPFAGAWQKNIEWTTQTVLAYHAVYACITLIASDIAKLRIKLVEQDANGIWSETQSPAFSPFLRKPNHFQTRIQFIEWWILSKLIHGNVYALKERDNRGVVRAAYLLDPSRVKVLIADDGSVFYDLSQDNLANVPENVRVPASEIFHDRINCLFHPLIGTSPIFACGSAANVGLQIQDASTKLFANGGRPSGLLTAPGIIKQPEADEMKARWNAEYGGDNRGKVAVLGGGLKFEQLTMTSVDAQLIEQLKWTAETVCSVFHVPAFKIGVGTMPTYSNGEILDQRYYSDCLQSHIEHFELVMDEGLGISEKIEGKQLGVEMDLDGLLRMDTATQIETLGKGVGGGFMSPDEARKKIDLKPVPGGNTPYLQQQNYSLAALNKRDQQEDPFGTAKPKPAEPAAPGADPPAAPTPGDAGKSFDIDEFLKSVSDYEAAHV